jgi:hypothetical protein
MKSNDTQQYLAENHQPSYSVAYLIAEKLADIAELGRGDRALGVGSIGAAMETAVSERGADLTSIDTLGIQRLVSHDPFDVVFWAANNHGPDAQTDWVDSLKPVLRTGARLIMWDAPDSSQHVSILTRRMRRIILTAGFFTSIIVGHLPQEVGTLVVATGVCRR